MKIFAIVVITLALLGVVSIALVYSGAYDVAATREESAFGRWLFTTVRNQSIEEASDKINPPQLTDDRLIKDGADHYASTCAVCHGAPGRELSEISKGMNPSPPELHSGEPQKEYSDAELYWIIKHGIRMTGMPAFGPTHKDDDLWAMVAFIKKLPKLTPEQYQFMTKNSSHGS